jgi:type IV pilus assembly protein PilQ
MKSIHIIIILVAFLVLPLTQLLAQDRPPVREFTPRDAIVTLDRTLRLDQAVIILNDYSIRFERKNIINRSGFNEPIGVSIPGLYWFDALQMIASINQLQLREFPDRIEIMRQETVGETAGTTGQRRAGSGPAREIYPDMREIEISAVFFEGNRTFLREIGVNWSAIRDGMVSVTNLGATNVSEPQFSVDANISEMMNTGRWSVDALLNTLEANDKGEILSSPKIKVMEGEVGRIQVGQDFSIKQRDFAGNVIDQFFSTGTILTVRPWLIRDEGQDFIYMEVDAERSSAQPGAISTVINKQEASTRILLLSGETAAIAGLYETEETKLRRGVPILKDLPGWFLGLRYLFGYEKVEYKQKELVIVITANLIPGLAERSIEDIKSREFIRQQLEEYRRRVDLD